MIRTLTKGKNTYHSCIFTILITALLYYSIKLAIYPTIRMFTIPSINYNEGWNAYRDQIAGFHYSLYTKKPTLSVTNYPPVSFYIVGFFGRLIKNFLLAGRLISILCLVMTCVFIFLTIKKTTGFSRSGIYAGLTFFVSVAIFEPERIGMDDPEFLAVLFAILGLYGYVNRNSNKRWLYISAFSISLSLFTKQDIISLPISIFLDLLFFKNWKSLIHWTSACIISATLLVLFVTISNGQYFFENIFSPRAYSLGDLLRNTIDYGSKFYISFGLCILIILYFNKFYCSTFFKIFFITSFCLSIIFAGGDGVSNNIFNMQIIAAIFLISSFFSSITLTSYQRNDLYLWTIFFLANISLILCASNQLIKDQKEARELPVNIQATERAVSVLNQHVGPIICEDLLLCFEAGKTSFFDAYFVKDQISLGRLNEDTIISQIKSHYFSAIEIGNIEDPGANLINQHFRFTQNFMSALIENYDPNKISNVYTIYTPK